jgi:hypothetical protein
MAVCILAMLFIGVGMVSTVKSGAELERNRVPLSAEIRCRFPPKSGAGLLRFLQNHSRYHHRDGVCLSPARLHLRLSDFADDGRLARPPEKARRLRRRTGTSPLPFRLSPWTYDSGRRTRISHDQFRALFSFDVSARRQVFGRKAAFHRRVALRIALRGKVRIGLMRCSRTPIAGGPFMHLCGAVQRSSPRRDRQR